MSNYHIGKWNDLLTQSDVEGLWSELHRVISKHKLARIQVKNDGFIDEGKYNYYTDLTQELFTILLEKNRFQHYIDTEMSDVEIELEISQIEVTNMMMLQVRKQKPESFRISRRISNILKNSELFTSYSNPFTRSSEKSYGLSEWNDLTYDKITPLHEAVMRIPHQTRDLRYVGRTADTQIIISNEKLEALIKAIFEVLGRPLTVAEVREVAMKKITILDVQIDHIEDYQDDDKPVYEIADTRPITQNDVNMQQLVTEFLDRLWKAVKQKQPKFVLITKILWLNYLSKENISQFEASKQLGISDASVSNYRKIIEAELKEVKISDVSQGFKFKEALSARVNQLINTRVE